ncbi:class I SAM-dependent DNA methyltransferase [Nostoc sp.]|uniref:class I SAM-dependent DNA methyltransferase n=1 Tax=Nostoc sp. TaxID=1180 RepID=UPI002FFA6679
MQKLQVNCFKKIHTQYREEKDFMSSINRYVGYDPIARLYNEDWAPSLAEKALLCTEKLFLPYLPNGAHILDLGCGTGQLTKQLLIKGYKVTALDGSEAMLHYAQENATGGEFILGDARSFEMPSTFDGVVSATCVLNYVMNIEELTVVFHNIYKALLPNGIFIFDLDTEEQYKYFLEGSLSGNIKDEFAWAALRTYDPEDKTSQVKFTIFSLLSNNQWQRFDHSVIEKCYSKEDVISALSSVGFIEINLFDAERDFGRNGEAGTTYFVCRKSE